MTYAAARAKLVSVIAGTTPTTSIAAGDAAQFAHLPEMSSDAPDRPVRTRSFGLEAAVDGDGAGDYPYTPDIGGQPRVRTRMTLTVHYREVRGKRADLDVQIQSDAEDLWKRLATPSNFSPRTTTNIDYVDGISWRRVPLPSGDAQLRLSFDLHYL